MNPESMNAKIYKYRGVVALKIGFDHAVYRPVMATSPLTNSVAVIKAAFNAGDNKYVKPNMLGDAVWFGDFDANQTQVGDYLVKVSDPSDIRFIAAQQPLLPIIMVQCNRSIRLARSTSNTGVSNPSQVGAVGYSGSCASVNETVDILGSSPDSGLGLSDQFIGWPCSILQGKGSSKVPAPLPTSALNMYGWDIILPVSVPAIINAGDTLTDDLGRDYSVRGAELTDLGWRVSAVEIHQ